MINQRRGCAASAAADLQHARRPCFRRKLRHRCNGRGSERVDVPGAGGTCVQPLGHVERSVRKQGLERRSAPRHHIIQQQRAGAQVVEQWRIRSQPLLDRCQERGRIRVRQRSLTDERVTIAREQSFTDETVEPAIEQSPLSFHDTGACRHLAQSGTVTRSDKHTAATERIDNQCRREFCQQFPVTSKA